MPHAILLVFYFYIKAVYILARFEFCGAFLFSIANMMCCCSAYTYISLMLQQFKLTPVMCMIRNEPVGQTQPQKLVQEVRIAQNQISRQQPISSTNEGT